MAARPNSLAGKHHVAAAYRTGAACWSRSIISARASAAGCAGTTAGVNRSAVTAAPADPGRAHQDARLLVQRAGKIQHRRPGPERLRQCLRVRFRTAKKREVDMFESVRADGLNEGDLVAHLIQLAQPLPRQSRHEIRRGQRRL